MKSAYDELQTNEENTSNINIPEDNGAALSFLESAIQETELVPLLSDHDTGMLESELIRRDCDALEEELQERMVKKAQEHTQVVTFAFK